MAKFSALAMKQVLWCLFGYLLQVAGVMAQPIHTLPVVVHVIHNGEAIGSPNNPSDAAIQSLIDGLNAAFRKNGPLFGGVDVRIQFQLAVRSPQCGSTTGINRTTGNGVANYTTGGIAIGTFGGSADEIAVKNLSRWPNTDYVNIWIVHKINGSSTAGGFAYFPEYNTARTDGVVLTAGTVNDTNKTIVHEMGHYLNLHHTFHDDGTETNCPSSVACATTGDRICDTEPMLNVSCNTPLNVCTGLAFQQADAGLNYTVLNNYMSHTNCQWMFTGGQRDRMRDALTNFRGGLLTSGGLTLPATGPPMACPVTTANGPSPFFGVERLRFGTLDVYSNSSEADATTYADRTCNQRVTLERGQSYTLTVQGSYDNYQYLQAYIDYNRNGSFADPGETILNTMGGNATITVTIPTTGVATNQPLRLRVVADNPNGPAPTACSLMGTSAEGVGQAEDYSVLIVPRLVTSVLSGSWAAPGTWSCGCVPGGSDAVEVKTGHTINLGSGLMQVSALRLSGRLQYGTGGRLLLTGN